MRINEILNEDLRKWFKEKWVRFGPDGKIRGDCARGSDSEGKPKCLPQSKAHSLGKKGRASAAARKRREDPNPERKGKAKNVATKKKTNEGTVVPFERWVLVYNINYDDDDVHAPTKFKVKVPADIRGEELEEYLSDFITDKTGYTHMGFEYKPVRSVTEAEKKFSLSDLDYYLQHPEQMSDDEFKREFGMTRAEAEQQFGGQIMHDDDEYDMTDDQVEELLGISNNSNKRWTDYGDPIHESCPHCGGELVSEEDIMEKKDACYYKVKSRYKVWPSAYASGALVQCRKKGAKNWGSKK